MSHPTVLDPGAIEHLAREINSQFVAISNKLTSRRQHPSYGITKAILRTDLSRIEGALAAYGLLTGAQFHLNVFFPALTALGLVDRYREVRDAI